MVNKKRIAPERPAFRKLSTGVSYAPSAGVCIHFFKLPAGSHGSNEGT